MHFFFIKIFLVTLLFTILPFDSPILDTINIVLFTSLTLLALYSHFLAMTQQPGILPLNYASLNEHNITVRFAKLFDERDMAAITSPDYPGERLVVCRNPDLARERARKRQDLLAATEKDLAAIAAAVRRSRKPPRGARAALAWRSPRRSAPARSRGNGSSCAATRGRL